MGKDTELEALSLLMMGTMAAACIYLSLVRPAPYGRYSEATVHNQWWISSIKVPAQLAWIVQESPALVVAGYLGIQSEAYTRVEWANAILWGLFIVHYAHRSLVYPFCIRNGTPSKLHVVCCAFVFCAWNGYLQGKSLSNTHLYPTNWIWQPCFIFGIIIFAIGWMINYQSDKILQNLRDNKAEGGQYKIPYGGFFEYVSCANYFGEVVAWTGYAIASMSIPAITFACATMLNLVPRAMAHHRWYHAHFKSYPKKRHAIIPFIL